MLTTQMGETPSVALAAKSHTCPRCGWNSVRSSMQQGLGDTLVALVCLEPKRCSKCLHRFYRFNRRAKYVLPLMLCLLVGGVQLKRQYRQYRIDEARERAVQMMAVPGGGPTTSSTGAFSAKPDPKSGK